MYFIDGVKSHAGSDGVNQHQIAQEFPMATRFGRKKPSLESKTLLRSKLMQGSSGYPEVKLRRHAVWLPNFLGRTSDKSVMHWRVQRIMQGSAGSTTGQIA